MAVNVPNKTYDVYVTPPGGTEIHLATGYSFRTEQSSASTLNNLGIIAATGSHQLTNFTIVPKVQYVISASADTGGSISPTGTTAVSSGGSQIYTITPSTGYKIAGVTVDGASVGAVSSYTFSSVTANHTIAASFTATVTAGTVTFAGNSGGTQFKDSKGTTYLADSKYSGGSVGKTTAAIAGTVDDSIYQTERYGNFSYSIPVANGNYNVTLKFAETYFAAAGKRVFSVKINGQTVISNLDIYAKAGKNKAYDVVIPASVTNGMLNVEFVSQVNNAKVSGILVTAR